MTSYTLLYELDYGSGGTTIPTTRVLKESFAPWNHSPPSIHWLTQGKRDKYLSVLCVEITPYILIYKLDYGSGGDYYSYHTGVQGIVRPTSIDLHRVSVINIC